MRRSLFCSVLLLAACALAAQTLPRTAGETLSGKPIMLAQATQGHPAILVAGFSHEGGQRCTPWMQAIQKDPALAGVPVYEIAMLAKVPSLLRGTIKGMIRKGVPPAQQDRFVVLLKDEEQWRSFFRVSDENDAYVVLLDSAGKVLWSGHGSPQDLEPKLAAALR